MRRTAAVLAIMAALTFASPVAAVWEPLDTRCVAMVGEVNRLRAAPDLRVNALLCKVAARRAYDMAVGGYFRHDLGPVVRALNASGTCWLQVGEVIAWNGYWVDSREWVSRWWASPGHRALLEWSGYNRAGGHYTGQRYRWPYNVAVMYALRTCA